MSWGLTQTTTLAKQSQSCSDRDESSYNYSDHDEIGYNFNDHDRSDL